MMADEPEITVAELREASRRLLDAAERRLGSTVELQADTYWGLFAPEMFEQDSPDVLERSLSDDVSEIRALVSRPEDSFEDDVMLWHDMNHLVGILQRVSALTT
jgi:hypothetical protein